MSEPLTRHLTIAGLSTSASVIGEGKPILTLHGWGGNIRSFWPVAQRLAPRGYQVHLLDLPGFGQTAPPPVPWGVADYMQFVAAYLDNCALESVAVLGHSFGGRIALMLAAEYPQRVYKMVLADSAGLRTPPTLKQRLRSWSVRRVRWILDGLGLKNWRAWLQNRYNQRFASEDYLNAGPLRQTFVRVIEQDLTPFAQRVQAPTLLIWGDQDVDTPLWQGRRLEQLIPDAGLVVFQGAGHFAYLERLGEYVQIVEHFLRDGG